MAQKIASLHLAASLALVKDITFELLPVHIAFNFYSKLHQWVRLLLVETAFNCEPVIAVFSLFMKKMRAPSEVFMNKMRTAWEVFVNTLKNAVWEAYLDSSVIIGEVADILDETLRYKKIEYMTCGPQDNFFPDLTTSSRTDIIIFCSPNNPTSHAASREQLTHLVEFARKNGSIIVNESAYSVYMKDKSPKSIYEIPGARENPSTRLLGSRVFVMGG